MSIKLKLVAVAFPIHYNQELNDAIKIKPSLVFRDAEKQIYLVSRKYNQITNDKLFKHVVQFGDEHFQHEADLLFDKQEPKLQLRKMQVRGPQSENKKEKGKNCPACKINCNHDLVEM